jgi:hypothetical protein
MMHGAGAERCPRPDEVDHIVLVRLVSAQTTVDATPVVKIGAVVAIAAGTVACRAPIGGTTAYRVTAASLVCAVHGQCPKWVVVPVIRAPRFLARDHST